MSKEPFVPLTAEIIEDRTLAAAEKAARERELLLERQLIPELRKELAAMEAQEMEIARVEAEIDVMNLASEFTLRIKGGEFERAYKCFALETPGVCAELSGIGIYEGPDALKAYYVDYLPKIAGGEGCFKLNHICTPVVEVARDGQTARGMWLSVGMEALKREDLAGMYPDPLSVWVFGTWCMEFVQENGVWKIWHLQIFDEVQTVYEKGWSETADSPIPRDPGLPPVSKASTRHNPFHTGRKPVLHAEPPVPYPTYADGMSF